MSHVRRLSHGTFESLPIWSMSSTMRLNHRVVYEWFAQKPVPINSPDFLHIRLDISKKLARHKHTSPDPPTQFPPLSSWTPIKIALKTKPLPGMVVLRCHNKLASYSTRTHPHSTLTLDTFNNKCICKNSPLNSREYLHTRIMALSIMHRLFLRTYLPCKYLCTRHRMLPLSRPTPLSNTMHSSLIIYF